MKTAISAAALTARQSRFVDEYIIDISATQTAIRAGYSKKTAGRGMSWPHCRCKTSMCWAPGWQWPVLSARPSRVRVVANR
ncbi:terminase small subunit [Halomonas sp. PAMB 3232]|uniref:terminase small subunit n=1 Tax=unclassified Halomonas TaxID=2609666 RepID=UPI0039083F34